VFGGLCRKKGVMRIFCTLSYASLRSEEFLNEFKSLS
jgi:hypothetical protein